MLLTCCSSQSKWYDRTSRKEFSNDPTTAMTNLSESFEMRMSAAQIDLHALKKAIDDNRQWIGHQQAHYK